jgi:hypothetical protein
VLTPNQNLVVAGVDAADRAAIEALVAAARPRRHARHSPSRLAALACVALPTCPLAMAEAERYLPAFLDRFDGLLATHGLARDTVRCASPAARTAARGRTWPRSGWSARRRAATTCTSAATSPAAAQRAVPREHRRGRDLRRARPAVRARGRERGPASASATSCWRAGVVGAAEAA